MATQKSNLELENQTEQIDFLELEPLLWHSLKNKELQVVSYTATRLLPPGENYCSIMVKLDIKLRKGKSAKEEILQLVAKTPSCTDRPIVEWSVVFKKELFLYAELRPLYKQLEREAGIPETNLIDVWPEYIGYRNSLKNGKVVDENSALLMKNIKVDGFYTGDRHSGLDTHHCRVALSSLARYHALGIALKQKRPDLANKAQDQARRLGVDFEQLDVAYDKLRETLKKILILQKHWSTIELSFDRLKGGKNLKAEPKEPWATITHGDFWTNNILFHKDAEGNIDDVKFVDFQTYLYSSPLKDVPYFFSGSLNKVTQENYLEELIVLYYNSFIEALKRMNCDTAPFTRNSFDLELKNQAIIEFPLFALTIKIFAYENNDESKNNEELMNDVFEAKPSESFIERLKCLIQMYEKMGWF